MQPDSPTPAAPALAVGQVWMPTKGHPKVRTVTRIGEPTRNSVWYSPDNAPVGYWRLCYASEFAAWIARHRAVVGE
jgi:hypothetical protein